MATTTQPSGSTDTTAAHDLNEFGYGQDLHRSIGTYASFAAGFSFVSILTTIFQLFGFGFSFGGPTFFWTWPAVFLGQLLVALCFAELAARYPLSGAIYQWARRLGGSTVGWFAGWTMIIAQIVTVAAAAIAMQAVLPAIWSGFQVVGGDPSIASLTGATNAILLGLVVLTITTLINSVAVRVMAVVNAVGVTAELIGVVLLIVALFSTSVRGPGIVLDTSGVTSFSALLAAGLMAGYVLVGFDSAGELAEETHNPRRTTPKTILRALIVSGIGGALILLGALMAAPTLDDELSGGGLAYVVTSRLGDVWGRVFLADVVLAAFVCTLAIQTATTRMIFSMSRDEVLPFSRKLRTVSARGATVHASVLVGVGAAALLLVNLGHAGVFTALTSTCIVLLYIAYLCVTAPMLYRRLKGWPKELGPQQDELGKPVFSLGRWGLPINVLAVLWGLAMAINLVWPRQEVYDPEGTSPVLQYFGVIFVALTAIGGYVAFTVKKKAYRAAIAGLPGSDTAAAPRIIDLTDSASVVDSATRR
ncbi:amino acid/polyamine/organocation transporter, APC superfamily [Quadrisphaera granulorum]|uniref:Amino acid/polyamine/organocation transporter (APC superfamily) n=1 Tax=Quadrisphaera granulorum TaxID=317664 RepID=A0A316A564_9ACTN|nr:amino acid permease [Quadrisphaera granulorum]PWJ53056.1 amino acid/polyamine/organocation transporter (APC superfamily) [Quadrisphaera granulorum]SZE97221.1 amino acid/polyamine/organocation transporter, APC superfamily [Quadrisphaera granulorum]